MNIDMTRYYSNPGGYGILKEELRGSFLSDYDYSKLALTWINHQDIWKLELHTRLFLQTMYGNNPAPESMLNIAGGNNEEMMDNAFIRSRGFVPAQWLGYGDNYNHFQFAGGLNIRGYAGYLVPVNSGNQQFYLYSGMNGASVNAELDFDKLIPLQPKGLRHFVHVDLYLFGDAGYLERQYLAGTNGFSENTFLNTGLLASAGDGIAVTIKRFGNLNEIRPLTLRCDMPWFLSNTPYVDGQNFRFRWIVGLSRAF
jgi:aminopeptidase N